jgi:RNA polymerase sigma-70 factor (ECF subfamily)
MSFGPPRHLKGCGPFAWLYKIATNACLGMMRRTRTIAPPPELLWLEPYPDALLGGLPDDAPGPDAVYGTREAVGLAFVTALQHLPARQRAVLVLRDVLGFRAAEAAEMLGASEAWVTSALQRARGRLEELAPRASVEEMPAPGSAAERELVARFADAFERGDVDAVVGLLTHDARLTMPPEPFEFHGPAAIGRFLSTVPAAGALERFSLVATRANGQPAFGCYLRDPGGGPARASGLMVLTLRGDLVAGITGFPDTAVFRSFGLPRTLRVEPL